MLQIRSTKRLVYFIISVFGVYRAWNGETHFGLTDTIFSTSVYAELCNNQRDGVTSPLNVVMYCGLVCVCVMSTESSQSDYQSRSWRHSVGVRLCIYIVIVAMSGQGPELAKNVWSFLT